MSDIENKTKKSTSKDSLKIKAIEVDIIMSLFMGLVLGFFLPLIGMLRSAHFSLQGFLMGFFISFLVSVVLGVVIPARRVNMSLNRRLKLKNNAISTLFLNTLVTDILYVPVISFFVVTLSYRKSIAMGAEIDYLDMLIKAIAVSLLIGYMLIFIAVPNFKKITYKIVKTNDQEMLDEYEDRFIYIKPEDDD